MEKRTIRIKGMSCEHCVQSIKESLEALPGVGLAKPDLQAKTVALEFDPAKTPLGKIKGEIENLGFDVAD